MKRGDVLEGYVQYVYDTLLNLRGRQVVVGKDVTLTGKANTPHQIDVYYEFEQAGIKHRVAIECKDTGRPVEKSEVESFGFRLNDIGNVVGVMISRSGFQSGAKAVASHYGVLLLKANELPNILQLLAMRVKSTMLPDESFVGEPFWIPMDMRDGEFTGGYCLVPNKADPNTKLIPLFVSKPDAMNFAQRVYKPGTFTVRGIPQHSLKALVGIAKVSRNTKFVIFFFPPPSADLQWIGDTKSPDEIAEKFILT